jgi:DNA-binding NarL/FixJ family response regulator
VTIRVLLADDQTLVRAAFAMLVKSAQDMVVVGQAATGRETVELTRRERADLVVMAIRMPDRQEVGHRKAGEPGQLASGPDLHGEQAEAL